MLSLTLLLGITLFSFYQVGAQTNLRLSIDQIDSDNFPQVEVFISVLDTQGYPIQDLTGANISVSEDQQVVSPLEVVPTYQQPLDIALVIDTSLTMGYGEKPTPIQNTIETAKDFVASLAAQDQVAVISFSDDVSIVQELTSDKSLVMSALDGLELTGYTALNDALIDAVDLLKEGALRPTIILITDGKDSGISAFTFDEAIDAAVNQSIVVYTLGWGAVNRDELENLADLTHGQAQVLPDSQPDLMAFQAAFSRLNDNLKEFREQYRLSFTSSLPADGKEHEIVVQVDHLGGHVEETRRFVAELGEVIVTLPDFTEGQVVWGNVYFAPDVIAPAPLAQLDILIDGQPLTTVHSPPYEFEWDSTTVLPGEHEFKFIAQDSAGNSGQTNISLVIEPPLSLVITSPMGGETITGPILISSDVPAHDKIAKVEFYLDGKLLDTLENPPYEVNWTPIGLEASGHEIVVKAVDINGFSDEMSIKINVGGQKRDGLLVLVVGVILASVVLAIPLGLRARKRIQARKGETPSTKEKESVIPLSGVSSARLREIDGLNPNQNWMLTTTEEIHLGRKRDVNDIPLKGGTASREQAIIRFQDGNYYIFNIKPENPLLINGVPVVQQHLLQHGDKIQAGESVFRFEAEG